MNSVSLGGRLQNIISYHVFTTRQGKPNPSLIFSMYTRRPFKDHNGQYQNDFFNVVYNGRGAQYVRQYGRKGGMVNVIGRLQNHTYNHTTTDQIIAREVELPRPSQNMGSFTTRRPRNNQGGNRPQPRTNNQGFNRGAGAPQQSFNNRVNDNGANNTPSNQNQPTANQNNNQQTNNQTGNASSNRMQQKPITPDGKDLPF